MPNICLLVGSQYIDVGIEQNSCLQSVNLADRGDSSNKEIDLLIGADFYWKLVNDETKRIKDVGLFAIKSILGWLINDPISKRDDIVKNSVNLIQSSHVLKVSYEVKNEDLLIQNSQRFWNLDLLGFKENEKLVYEDVDDEIKLEGNRYTVKLPFKENHPANPENYLLSAKRLKGLKNRLDKDKSLLQKYDDVIKEQLELGIIEKVDTTIVAGEGTYTPHREVIREVHVSTK